MSYRVLFLENIVVCVCMYVPVHVCMCVPAIQSYDCSRGIDGGVMFTQAATRQVYYDAEQRSLQSIDLPRLPPNTAGLSGSSPSAWGQSHIPSAVHMAFGL